MQGVVTAKYSSVQQALSNPSHTFQRMMSMGTVMLCCLTLPATGAAATGCSTRYSRMHRDPAES